MGRLVLNHVVCFVVLLILTAAPLHVASDQAALFVFGDSLFDPGNNQFINSPFQANYTPYGISYFNPPTGRFSDGRLIPDFIAEYAGLPLVPAFFDPTNNDFSRGANFASAGAGALVDTYTGLVADLKTQVERFGDLQKNFTRSLGDANTTKLLSDAVYLFNCGGNDYLSPVGNPASVFYNYTREQYVDIVVGNITDAFKGVYEKGGRKFGILNIPSLACLPSIRAVSSGNSCNPELDVLANQHNQLLSKKLQQLEKKLEGFKYAIFDFSTAAKNRNMNPSKYGFKVVDSACCGSGPFRGINSCGGRRNILEYELCDNIDEYLLFDAPHPTQAANRQYAGLFWNGTSDATAPYNLKTLFQG